jgi:hypothetical protein
MQLVEHYILRAGLALFFRLPSKFCDVIPWLFTLYFEHKLKSNVMYSEVCFDMVFKLFLELAVFIHLT